MIFRFMDYTPDDREIKALEELLPYWQQYEGAEGTLPFKDWNIEDLFRSLAEVGIKNHISHVIKQSQYTNGLIGVNELCNRRPFLTKEERENGRRNITNESIEKVLRLSDEGEQLMAENGQVYQLFGDKEECDAVGT